MYFYNGEPVTKVRFYTVGNRSLVEFTQVDGSKKITDGSELTTEIPKEFIADNKQFKQKTTEQQQEQQQEQEQEQDESTVETETETEIETVVEADSFEPFTLVSKDGEEEIKIESKEDLEAVYEAYGLTEEGVTGLLEGTQKSHKGFKISK